MHLHLALAPCTYTLCQRFVDIEGQIWNWSFQAWLSGTFSSCIRNVDAKCKVQVLSIHEDNVPESQARKLQFQVCPAMSTKRWHKVQVQQLHDWSRKTNIVTSHHRDILKSKWHLLYLLEINKKWSFVQTSSTFLNSGRTHLSPFFTLIPVMWRIIVELHSFIWNAISLAVSRGLVSVTFRETLCLCHLPFLLFIHFLMKNY